MYDKKKTLKLKEKSMESEVRRVLVENLELGMLVGLEEAARVSKRPKFDEETILNFDAEWVEVSKLEESGNRIIVSVDRDYLPDVPVFKGTEIPVLVEE